MMRHVCQWRKQANSWCSWKTRDLSWLPISRAMTEEVHVFPWILRRVWLPHQRLPYWVMEGAKNTPRSSQHRSHSISPASQPTKLKRAVWSEDPGITKRKLDAIRQMRRSKNADVRCNLPEPDPCKRRSASQKSRHRPYFLKVSPSLSGEISLVVLLAVFLAELFVTPEERI